MKQVEPPSQERTAGRAATAKVLHFVTEGKPDPSRAPARGRLQAAGPGPSRSAEPSQSTTPTCVLTPPAHLTTPQRPVDAPEPAARR
jgi:hypothetical protein